MKKALLTSCLVALTSPVLALDFSYGKGDFSMSTAINPLLSGKATLAINTWSLSEKHKAINNSRLYYHFKLDYFNSDSVNQFTDFASTPLNSPIPLLGSSIDDLADQFTQLPIPADYRISGVNFDIGLGYDLIKTPNRTVGVALNTGISTPFMKIRNMRNTANLVIDLLDTFDTRVKTYKLGGSLYGEYKINNAMTISGNGSINYQTGQMDNDIVGSGINIDGSYTTFDLSLKYQLERFKNTYLTAGYNFSKWNYDSARVTTPVGAVNIPRVMDIGFDASNLYLGLGYSF